MNNIYTLQFTAYKYLIAHEKQRIKSAANAMFVHEALTLLLLLLFTCFTFSCMKDMFELVRLCSVWICIKVLILVSPNINFYGFNLSSQHI